MKWEAAQIARFARGAGFRGDDLRTAIAVAIAGSGGIPHYDVRAGIPGAGHWQGLWAIDTDRHAHLAGADLHVPQNAARAAYDLTTQHDGWSWSPVWRAGAHVVHLAHAGTEQTRELAVQPARTPYLPPVTALVLQDCRERAARAATRLTHLRP